MVNICLLFGIFPNSLKSEIEQKSKGAIQYAADALQKCFIAGLTEHYNNVNIVNLPFISRYRNIIEFYITKLPFNRKICNPCVYQNYLGIFLKNTNAQVL